MNFFGHLKTITGHRNKVMVHCFKCGIPFQGLTHDLSKYTPVEFFTGCKYYIGTRSPNEGERAEKGYSLSWMHHKGRNKHHFEYWTDVSQATKRYEPVKMPPICSARFIPVRLPTIRISIPIRIPAVSLKISSTATADSRKNTDIIEI